MANEFASRDLSACEILIMKSIWDHEDDIQLKDLMETLRTRYDKDYARTTVATFLSRLAAKGYIETYRQGRVSFTHAVKQMEEYLNIMFNEEADFWFDNNLEAMIAALCTAVHVTKADAEALKRVIDRVASES